MGKPSTRGFSRTVKPSSYHDQAIKERKREELVKDLVKELKPPIVSIVERAFRRFCQKHGVSLEVEEQEWQRFKKILHGML